MTIEVRGSFGDEENGITGFGGGDFEGMSGTVLSVHSIRNDPHASTGNVKLNGIPQGLSDIYAVPVAYLWPVPPSNVGDKAAVLHGGHQGSIVRLRERASRGWFVSSDRSHFEIEASWLVGVLDVDH